MLNKAMKMVEVLRNSYDYSERRDLEAADLIETLLLIIGRKDREISGLKFLVESRKATVNETICGAWAETSRKLREGTGMRTPEEIIEGKNAEGRPQNLVGLSHETREALLMGNWGDGDE